MRLMIFETVADATDEFSEAVTAEQSMPLLRPLSSLNHYCGC